MRRKPNGISQSEGILECPAAAGTDLVAVKKASETHPAATSVLGLEISNLQGRRVALSGIIHMNGIWHRKARLFELENVVLSGCTEELELRSCGAGLE